MVSRFNSYGIDCLNVYVGYFDHLILSQNNYVGLAPGRRGMVQDCLAFSNSLDGFYVASGTTIKNCIASENNGTGIHVLESGSTIEKNQVIHNGIGLKVDLSGNLIVLNSSTQNVTNQYSIAPNNMAGPVVSENSNPLI